jgi:uncharacterized protein YndB with AHSA1/START domain
MSQSSGSDHATLVFNRVISAPCNDVYIAFADAKIRSIWSAPPDDVVIYDQVDFQEGCQDQFRCGPKSEPNIHGVTHYWDIIPNQRIIFTEILSRDGNMKLAVSTTTIELVVPIDHDSTKVTSTVQMVSLVGQNMIKGFSDGYNGALDNLEQYFHSRESS